MSEPKILADWPDKVDAVTNDPVRIEQRNDIAPGVTVPRTRAGAA